MRKIYLNPNADAYKPEGTRVVSSETEFWIYALRPEPLVVQGLRLCEWAREFAEGRGLEVEELPSPSRILKSYCPDLDAYEMQELAPRLASVPPEPTWPQVAYALWKEDWFDATGPELAAHWLLWLLGEFSEAERKVLRCLGAYYQSRVEHPFAQVFSAFTPEKAWECLEDWLGLKGEQNLGSFPLDLPPRVRERLQRLFRADALQLGGRLTESLRLSAHFEVLKLAAEADALYLKEHPEMLTKDYLDLLHTYLSRESREILRRLLRPMLPGPIPSEPDALVSWFIHEYLPYREWAPDEQPEVQRIGREFSLRYLELYREALSGAAAKPWLSWVKAGELRRPDRVTLLLVLDGLSFPDARLLWEELQRREVSGRLTLLSEGLAFAPLPTLTKLAKLALLRGVKPALAPDHPEIGTIYSRDRDVERALKHAQPGDLLIFSLTEPDKSYHDNPDKKVARDKANGALVEIAGRLIRLIFAAPDGLPLEVVITTDHGRLLSGSSRAQVAPSGMRPEGRAAVGGNALREPIEVRGDLAFLHREAYGLPEDCAVILSGDTFLMEDGKTGHLAYPHGGAWPEEVLIPFFVLSKDQKLLPTKAYLVGTGVAGRISNAVLVVENPNPAPVELVQLELILGGTHTEPLGSMANPMSRTEWSIDLNPWPEKKVLKNGQARLIYRLPGGKQDAAPVELRLTSLEMYEQNDILGDLL